LRTGCYRVTDPCKCQVFYEGGYVQGNLTGKPGNPIERFLAEDSWRSRKLNGPHHEVIRNSFKIRFICPRVYVLDVERMIDDDHSARSIWETIGRLDLSLYLAKIAAVEGRAGRDHTSPQLLISLWLYAYSRGISSAREIARRCEFEPAFQWLCGCSQSVIEPYPVSVLIIMKRSAVCS
jgi:hypothetical protein